MQTLKTSAHDANEADGRHDAVSNPLVRECGTSPLHGKRSRPSAVDRPPSSCGSLTAFCFRRDTVLYQACRRLSPSSPAYHMPVGLRQKSTPPITACRSRCMSPGTTKPNPRRPYNQTRWRSARWPGGYETYMYVWKTHIRPCEYARTHLSSCI